jgi:hypothetical protein
MVNVATPSSQKPCLLVLLKALATGRRDLWLGDFTDSQIDWAMQSGLGPVCFQVVKDNPNNALSPYWNLLKAADLTARMIAAEHLEAMRDIIDATGVEVPQLTLLKGISIAEEHYPEAHLRPMRDLDFLVPEKSLRFLQSVLERLGYVPKNTGSHTYYETHHHLVPFFNNQRHVWVEVHHRLLSTESHASRDGIFAIESVRSEIRPAKFHGRDVGRLSAEFQVVYLAAHWAKDFKAIGGIIAIMDLMLLLKDRGDRLRWEIIFEWLHGSTAAMYVYLLLSYMDRRRLISLPASILQRLYLLQRFFGKLSLAAAHLMIDQYMLDGRRFGVVLNRRNVSLAWETLMLPMSSPGKLLAVPYNLSVPSSCRIQ